MKKMKQLTESTSTARRALRVATPLKSFVPDGDWIWGTIFETHSLGARVVWDDGTRTDTSYDDLYVEDVSV